MIKVGVLIGSLRKESFNRKIALSLMKIAPPSLSMKIIEIGQLPFFNQDDEANPPQAWVDFREEIKAMDAFLLASPEYNRSVPPALKNALDVGSRPYGQNCWNAKPCAIISCSPGSTGGFGANHHLRQSLVFLNMPCMQQPEAYLGTVDKLLDEKGNLTNESTLAFLSKFMTTFELWIKANLPNPKTS